MVLPGPGHPDLATQSNLAGFTAFWLYSQSTQVLRQLVDIFKKVKHFKRKGADSTWLHQIHQQAQAQAAAPPTLPPPALTKPSKAIEMLEQKQQRQ